MSSHEIHLLLDQYGLGVVLAATLLQALGPPVPGTTVLIAAALYASTTHGLPIAGVIAAAWLGAELGTCLGFAAGRWRGEWVLLRVGRLLRQSPERVARLRADFAAHAPMWLFVGRFITGVRNVSGLVAGASPVTVARFVVISTAAALTWALVNGLEYYFFGRALAAADTWLQVVLVLAGLAWLALSVRLLRRRALRRMRASTEAEAEAEAELP